MKKIFAIAVLAFSVMSGLSAQNTLTIHQKDGQQFSYGFGEKPVVTFTDNDLIVTTANENVKLTLALTSVEKFTFDSNETAVNDIKDNAQKASISLDEYSVYIANVKENIEFGRWQTAPGFQGRCRRNRIVQHSRSSKRNIYHQL